MRDNFLLRYIGHISNIFLISLVFWFFFFSFSPPIQERLLLKPLLFTIFKPRALTHFCALFQLLWCPLPRTEGPSLCFPWGQSPRQGLYLTDFRSSHNICPGQYLDYNCSWLLRLVILHCKFPHFL